MDSGSPAHNHEGQRSASAGFDCAATRAVLVTGQHVKQSYLQNLLRIASKQHTLRIPTSFGLLPLSQNAHLALRKPSSVNLRKTPGLFCSRRPPGEYIGCPAGCCCLIHKYRSTRIQMQSQTSYIPGHRGTRANGLHLSDTRTTSLEDSKSNNSPKALNQDTRLSQKCGDM